MRRTIEKSKMNQIKRNLLFVFLFILVFVLSSCESEEDKLLREADKAFGRAVEDLDRTAEDMLISSVADMCSDECRIWGE